MRMNSEGGRIAVPGRPVLWGGSGSFDGEPWEERQLFLAAPRRMSKKWKVRRHVVTFCYFVTISARRRRSPYMCRPRSRRSLPAVAVAVPVAAAFPSCRGGVCYSSRRRGGVPFPWRRSRRSLFPFPFFHAQYIVFFAVPYILYIVCRFPAFRGRFRRVWAANGLLYVRRTWAAFTAFSPFGHGNKSYHFIHAA